MPTAGRGTLAGVAHGDGSTVNTAVRADRSFRGSIRLDNAAGLAGRRCSRRRRGGAQPCLFHHTLSRCCWRAVACRRRSLRRATLPVGQPCPWKGKRAASILPVKHEDLYWYPAAFAVVDDMPCAQLGHTQLSGTHNSDAHFQHRISTASPCRYTVYLFKTYCHISAIE